MDGTGSDTNSSMNREDEDVAEIISQCQQDLEEIKTAQIFGGDALQLHEFDQKLPRGFSMEMMLTLTPADPVVGVLPSNAELRWTNTNMSTQLSNNWFINPVYRTDGVFQWQLLGADLQDYDTYVTLQYIGDGTVSLVEVNNGN